MNALVALLCAVVVIGIWLATLQRIDAERKQAIAAARDANLNLAIAFEQQVHRTIKSAEQLASFVREQAVRSGKTELGRWLEEGLIRENMFTIINVSDENGDVVDSTQPGVQVNYADREFFTFQRDSTSDALFVSPPVVGRVSGEVRIPMSLRISRADGSFAGVVVLSVAPEDFTEFYREAYLGGRDMLELIGVDGVVRSRRAAQVLAKSEALYRATFDQAATGIAHVTPEGRILGANQKLHTMLAYEAGELLGCNLFDLMKPSFRCDASQFIEQLTAAEQQAAPPEREREYLRKDGMPVWVCETVGAVRTAASDIAYLVVVLQDITSRKALEARLAHDAMHDVLTGLPNRNMFHDRLYHALASARRYGRMAGVLYIDLDGFKEVNDSYGHAVGDRLLEKVARRLESSIRAEDTVARIGGDEFAVVLSTIFSEDDCRLLAQKLVDAISQPYEVGGRVAKISASIGGAVFPQDGEDAESLIQKADEAMYTDKRGSGVR